MDFQDKVILITGAGAGIGEAAALAFAKKGAKVVCNSVSESAKKVAGEIRDRGGESLFVQGDISDKEAVARVLDQTMQTYKRLDVLVNNAGIVLGGTIENTTLEDFHRTLDVNVIGTFLMSQGAVDIMKRQGGGRIVHVSSVAGIKGHVNRLAYSASKGAVIAMTKAMALELCHDNIQVNCVCPGTTLTPSLRERIRTSADPKLAMEQFCARQPIGRLGTPEEIAQAILFAASHKAGFMTGSILSIDGGMTM
ncbi:MAG: SDR family oxidoreductase [Lachnospiraceae bacterium]|nr:SDR family oxidoreductase [Lachnospiraceae bacterium]